MSRVLLFNAGVPTGTSPQGTFCLDTTNSNLYVNMDGATSWALLGPNSVLQQVHTQDGAVATGTTTIPFDDTIPQITEGDEYMTLAITPKSASSTLKIDVVMHLSHSISNSWNVAALFRDAVAGALANGFHFMLTAGGASLLCFSFQEASASLIARTYRVRGGSNQVGTMTFNGQSGIRKFGGVVASLITITELE